MREPNSAEPDANNEQDAASGPGWKQVVGKKGKKGIKKP